MNKNSLDFLDTMFVHNIYYKHQILIINQTHEGCILESNRPNIRVINSFEKGLSKSRNLALRNALAPIILISDDDVVYEKDFDKIILEAFNKNPKANLITFKAKNFEGKPYRLYPKDALKHDINTIKGVLSVEIAINVGKIRKLKIFFNERFGLGSEFETAEEYLFTREVLKRGSHCYFYNRSLVSHSGFNSGMDLGNDKIVYARAALNYVLYKNFAYWRLTKFVLFLMKNNYIKIEQVYSKFKVGLKGIKEYRLTSKKS